MSKSFNGDFSKERTLGKGTYGRVVLARSKKDGAKVAIKIINIKRLDDEHKKDAIREVLLTSKVHHPNIVQYKESFVEGDNVYIVMEYCEEGNLRTLLTKSQERLPQATYMNYFVQICLAMKHLHSHAILHRDIKSENVFVTRRGVLKLGDFGVARTLHGTLAQTQAGTPAYLPPEIVKGVGYNAKCDIWSLGVLLYEMATGKMPFTPEDKEERKHFKFLWRNIKKGSPRKMKGVPSDVKNLVLALLSKKPKERPTIDGILAHPLCRMAFDRLPNRALFNSHGAFMDKVRQEKGRMKGEADARVLNSGINELKNGSTSSSSSATSGSASSSASSGKASASSSDAGGASSG